MKKLTYQEFLEFTAEFYKRKSKYDKKIAWINKHIKFIPLNYIFQEIIDLFTPIYWRNPAYTNYYYVSTETISNEKVKILGKSHIIKGIAITLHGKYFILEDGSFIDYNIPYEYR